jgi:hypothetical protein
MSSVCAQKKALAKPIDHTAVVILALAVPPM